MGANLSDANLYDANLSSTNLLGTNLSGANLDANFNNTQGIEGADFTDAWAWADRPPVDSG